MSGWKTRCREPGCRKLFDPSTTIGVVKRCGPCARAHRLKLNAARREKYLEAKLGLASGDQPVYSRAS